MKKNYLRPCLIDGKRRAVFHKWIEEKLISFPSPMNDGSKGRQISQNFGLVEYDDGSCGYVLVTRIRFLDDVISDYFWSGVDYGKSEN